MNDVFVYGFTIIIILLLTETRAQDSRQFRIGLHEIWYITITVQTSMFENVPSMWFQTMHMTIEL